MRTKIWRIHNVSINHDSLDCQAMEDYFDVAS